MGAPERSVLHVLPHPAGGGETYVDLLSEMSGYRFGRVYLASGPSPSPAELVRGLVDVVRLVRRNDLLHVHGEVAAGLCLPLLATRRSVVTLHGLHLVRRVSGLRRQGAVLNLRAVLRTAERTICVSQAEHDELAHILGPAAARRAVVIRNGVHIPPPRSDADRAALREELGIPEHEPIGIWVGSLDERKDPLTAIRAANRAEVTLLVVGDGPLRPQVERTVGERVRALGRRDDVPRLLAAADFFVLTSHREGLALSLLEAMAHGLPVVVTDLLENIEALGDAGLVVPRGAEGALAAGFRRLASDERARRGFGAAARTRAVEHFDAQRVISRTRAVYESLLSDEARVR